jgi:hypothetical protein
MGGKIGKEEGNQRNVMPEIKLVKNFLYAECTSI